MRKFISLGTEIFLLPHGTKFSFEGREFFLRKEIFFRAHGNFTPSAEVGLALLEDGELSPQKKEEGPRLNESVGALL